MRLNEVGVVGDVAHLTWCRLDEYLEALLQMGYAGGGRPRVRREGGGRIEVGRQDEDIGQSSRVLSNGELGYPLLEGGTVDAVSVKVLSASR